MQREAIEKYLKRVHPYLDNYTAPNGYLIISRNTLVDVIQNSIPKKISKVEVIDVNGKKVFVHKTSDESKISVSYPETGETLKISLGRVVQSDSKGL